MSNQSDYDTETEAPLSQGEAELISALQPGMSQEFKDIMLEESDFPETIFTQQITESFKVKQEVLSPVMVSPKQEQPCSGQASPYQMGEARHFGFHIVPGSTNSFLPAQPNLPSLEPANKKAKWIPEQVANAANMAPLLNQWQAGEACGGRQSFTAVMNNQNNQLKQQMTFHVKTATLDSSFNKDLEACASGSGLIPDVAAIPKTGRYKFEIVFESKSKPPSKSCPFTYSEKLGRLFVRQGCTVPIIFRVELGLPSKDSSIRAFLMYKDKNSRNEVVERCPVHLKLDTGSKHAEHFLQTVRGDAAYQKCPITGRYVVTFRPNVTKNRCRDFQESMKFTCLTSCKGGVNRRPIVMYFILYVNGRVEGHVALDLWISSCPGRDRKSAELKLEDPLKPLGFPTEDLHHMTAASSIKHNQHSSAHSTYVYKHSSPHSTLHPQVNSSSETKTLTASSKDSRHERINSCDVHGKKKAKLLTVVDCAIKDDSSYYRVKIPPIKGLKNAKCILHIASLMTGLGELGEIQAAHATQSSSLVNERDMPTASQIFERTKLTTSVIKQTDLKRSFSDPLDYRKKYKKITVQINNTNFKDIETDKQF